MPGANKKDPVSGLLRFFHFILPILVAVLPFASSSEAFLTVSLPVSEDHHIFPANFPVWPSLYFPWLHL
jgi:hypothetical protein